MEDVSRKSYGREARKLMPGPLGKVAVVVVTKRRKGQSGGNWKRGISESG